MSKQANVEPSGLIEIARSFSARVNIGHYEHRDFFCSRKEECLKADAAATSARLHAFCQTEVARVVNEYLKSRAKKPAPAPVSRQTSFDSPFPVDDDVPF